VLVRRFHSLRGRDGLEEKRRGLAGDEKERSEEQGAY